MSDEADRTGHDVTSPSPSAAEEPAVLIMYGNMGRYGGIQSIVVRLVQHYRSIGIAAYCVTNAEKPIKEMPAETVLQGALSDSEVIARVLRLDGSAPLAIDILTMDPQSYARGYRLAARARKRNNRQIRLGLGIYHPRELFRETERSYIHRLNRVLAKSVGLEKLSFMSDETKLTHAEFLNDSLDNSPVVPLPIDKRAYRWQPPNEAGKLTIVSVGRIVPSKGYNFGAPQIVRRLLDKGVAVQWDLYGWGTHEAELKQQIAEADVGDSLRFMGVLALEQFDGLVAGYDLFIGMGSGALQAAQLGIPTICAVDSLADGCHGFFHEAPFGNLGDVSSRMAPKSIGDHIHRYARMSSDERQQLSEHCHTASKDYEVDGYVDRVMGASTFVPRWNHALVMIFSSAYNWILGDNAPRRAVRRFRTALGMNAA